MKPIDLSLLILRVGAGGMMMTHGWQKLVNFAQYSTQFPDPIGFGPAFALALTIFAEFVCSLLLILGVKTRYAAVPPLITMIVAAAVIHADDPFQKKELAILYGVIFLSLAIMGGGDYTLPKASEKLH